MSKHADEISHLSLAAEKIRKCEEDNEQLSAKIEELEKENTSLRAQLFTETVSDNSTSQADPACLKPIGYLHVTNLLDDANEKNLKSTFGQHGVVEQITMNEAGDAAFVTYRDESSAKKALTGSKTMRGITLKKRKLTIVPKYN